MSFKETKDQKAAKLLGLDTQDSSINIQHSGLLQLREAVSGPLLGWRKRFCVIKDGFFLWYNLPAIAFNNINNNNAMNHFEFDKKPKGVFPLNGAYVGLSQNDEMKCTLELIHPDIQRASFIVKAENKADAIEWLHSLENAKKATWENAQLGFAMLEKMKAEGTKLEAEKKAAVEALEQKIAVLNKANDQKMQIIQQERVQLEKFENQLKSEQNNLKLMNEEKQAVEEAVKQEEKVFKEAEEKRKQLEVKLGMANMALRRLEEALNVYFGFSEATKSQIPNSNANSAANAYRKAMAHSRNSKNVRRKDSARKTRLSKNRKVRERVDSGALDRKSVKRSSSLHSHASKNSKNSSTPVILPNMPGSPARKLSQQAKKSILSNQSNQSLISNNNLEEENIDTGNLLNAEEEEDVKQSVFALRNFFEDTFRMHKKNQERFVGNKLRVINQTLRRSVRKDVELADY